MNDKLYNTRELAKILNVSESAVRKWVFNEKIPYIKLGSNVRFTQDTVDLLMKEGIK